MTEEESRDVDAMQFEGRYTRKRLDTLFLFPAKIGTDITCARGIAYSASRDFHFARSGDFRKPIPTGFRN